MQTPYGNECLKQVILAAKPSLSVVNMQLFQQTLALQTHDITHLRHK